jgi:hypothetical protein
MLAIHPTIKLWIAYHGRISEQGEYLADGGVVEHAPDPRLAILHESVIVQAVVAHHAAQAVEVMIWRPAEENMGRIHILQEQRGSFLAGILLQLLFSFFTMRYSFI